MKDKMIQAYMKAAQLFSELSHARRLHVGAIVVKDDRIISIGYNGMPSGWDNNCEYEEVYSRQVAPGDDYELVHTGKLVTRPEVLHAETNAISKLAKSTESGDGASMFITHSPCLDCAKLIYQSGIKSVYYRESYRSDDGIQFLQKSGVQVEQVDTNS